MNRPRIVTLCGSTKFKEAFTKAALDLTLSGEIVLSVGGFRIDHGTGSSEDVWGEETKKALDLLHKWKIELSDRILVLNVGGYVGASTRSEIAFAILRGKSVVFLEGGGEKILEEIGEDHDCIRAASADVDLIRRESRRAAFEEMRALAASPLSSPATEEEVLRGTSSDAKVVPGVYSGTGMTRRQEREAVVGDQMLHPHSDPIAMGVLDTNPHSDLPFTTEKVDSMRLDATVNQLDTPDHLIEPGDGC